MKFAIHLQIQKKKKEFWFNIAPPGFLNKFAPANV